MEVDMRFEKVSYEAFKKDLNGCSYRRYSDMEVRAIYENIRIPERKTKYSAGYDFSVPISVSLRSGFTRVIPTGIKCRFTKEEASEWHLKLYIRSSLGVKHGIILRNCTGVIDADYYNNVDNEGDIMIALYNGGGDYEFSAGERVMQGVFERHGVGECDNATGGRKGENGRSGYR